jgi:hypothetical protein
MREMRYDVNIKQLKQKFSNLQKTYIKFRDNMKKTGTQKINPPPFYDDLHAIQSDQQETKSRVLPHLLFYRNVFLSWISRFYLLAVDTRFVGCLPLKNLSLIVFINFL